MKVKHSVSQNIFYIRNIEILEYLHLNFIKLLPLQYKFQVSLVLWNHNNGEDCWLGNGPEDDYWHPPQRGSLLKGVAVQGVLYQSILNAKLTKIEIG